MLVMPPLGPQEPPEPPGNQDQGCPQDSRSVLDLGSRLNEDQVAAVGMALEATMASEGWQYIRQLVDQCKAGTIQLIHRPDLSKDFISGMLTALDTIPANAETLVKKSRQIRVAREQQKQNEQTGVLLPFVKPGMGTPAG